MKAFINGTIILEDRQVMDGALLFDRKIAGIVSRDEAEHLADEVIDARGLYVSPGFIDVHIHGFAGEDASDGDAAGLRKMAEALTENGVTSFKMYMVYDNMRLSDGVMYEAIQYLAKENIAVKDNTVHKYIEMLENAKIISVCDS